MKFSISPLNPDALDLTEGHRADRLKFCVQNFRQIRSWDRRDLAAQSEVSEKTLDQLEALSYGRMTRRTFDLVAEGIGMTAEELEHYVFISGKPPPLDPAEMALLHYQINLGISARDKLANLLLDAMNLTGARGLGGQCGTSPSVIRNLTRGLQKRISRDILCRLAKGLSMQPIELMRHIGPE